jgi:hypothetical protein
MVVDVGSFVMIVEVSESYQAFRAPRAAAVAGVVFSVLMIVGLCLIRLSVPVDPSQPGTWVNEPARRQAVRFALNLFPFAGIAFLWFMGVLRNRLGAREDQFLATAFLGSGLLFVVSLFSAAALAAGLLDAVADGRLVLPDSETYYFGRRAVYTLLNVFAFKMAAVFMFSTGTIGLRTAFLPRWVAFVGYGCAAVLLLAITSWLWIGLLFPLWVMLVSAVVLAAEFGKRRESTGRSPPVPPSTVVPHKQGETSVEGKESTGG